MTKEDAHSGIYLDIFPKSFDLLSKCHLEGTVAFLELSDIKSSLTADEYVTASRKGHGVLRIGMPRKRAAESLDSGFFSSWVAAFHSVMRSRKTTRIKGGGLKKILVAGSVPLPVAMPTAGPSPSRVGLPRGPADSR